MPKFLFSDTFWKASSLVLALILVMLLLFWAAEGHSQELEETYNFTWDHNIEDDLSHYGFYEDNELVGEIPAGTNTCERATNTGLHTWYITAIDESNNESLPSNKVDNITPAPPCGLLMSK